MYSARTDGFIVLLSVLIFGALGLFVIISLTFLGADSIQFSEAKLYGAKARSFANTCGEAALEKIREFSCQSGGVMEFQQGYCTYLITQSFGTTYNITANGYAGNYTKSISIYVSQVSPTILVQWYELS